MAGGADRAVAARGSCPAIDSGQRRAAGHRLDPPRGPSGCDGGGGGSGDNRCAPAENGWGSPAGVDSAALTCGSGGTKSTGGLRGVGQSAGGDGSAGPARPVSGSSSDSSGPAHPSSRRGASSRSVTADFSSSDQTTRMSAALKYQPSRTRTRLTWAYPRLVHFSEAGKHQRRCPSSITAWAIYTRVSGSSGAAWSARTATADLAMTSSARRRSDRRKSRAGVLNSSHPGRAVTASPQPRSHSDGGATVLHTCRYDAHNDALTAHVVRRVNDQKGLPAEAAGAWN